MNTLKLVIPIMIVAFVIGCKPDKDAERKKKEAQITELQKERDIISKKIKLLESELNDTAKKEDLFNVTVVNIQPSVFKHYIEVQGKLDGEDYVDVAPEGVGVVEEVFVKLGQSVNKGQALARLNDAAGREQLKALETQYNLAKEAFDKQQRLWDQKIGSEMQY